MQKYQQKEQKTAGQYSSREGVHSAKEESEFSQTRINKEVLHSSVQHPGVLYPALAGVLGGVALALLGPTLVLTGLAIGGLTLAAAMWGINVSVRKQYFANKYIQKIYEELERERIERARELSRTLSELKMRNALSQFSRLTEKFDVFEKILSKKLNPTEITYSRYLAMAEQVYLSALDNLYSIVNITKSTQAIDVRYVENRISELKASGSQHPDIKIELESLQKRVELFYEQKEKIQNLFSTNEQAMTQLDIALAAISDMNTGDKHASMDLETAMGELERLANKADAYSRVSQD